LDIDDGFSLLEVALLAVELVLKTADGLPQSPLANVLSPVWPYWSNQMPFCSSDTDRYSNIASKLLLALHSVELFSTGFKVIARAPN
jgi:hypothetical protein